MATVQELITAEARRQGVSPELAIAVARKESGFNQSARGRAGEVGVFQLMPGTAKQMGVDPYDLQSNITGGIKYLARQLRSFGSPELALQAYNGGPQHVIDGNVSTGARQYASSILATVAAVGESTAASWGNYAWTGPTLPDLSTLQALAITPPMAAALLLAAAAAVMTLKS